MAETNLISITDVRNYRQVDLKFDAIKFTSFCHEIQRKNLRNLLGDALYKAFMSDNRIAGIYADLLNGKDYSYNSDLITFYGIKPILAYWWLAITTREGDLFLGTIGAIQFVNNQQQSFETAKEKERIAAGYMETAQGYANDLIKFLNYNYTSYSLWKRENNESNSTEFISFRL